MIRARPLGADQLSGADQLLGADQLSAVEDTLARVVMNLPFAAIVTEDNTTPQTIKWLNQAFTDTFGYTHADVPTINDWFGLAYPNEAYRLELLETWCSEVRRAFDTDGVVPTREVEIRNKQGQALRVLVSGQAFGGYLTTSFIDISEQRRTEAELRDVRHQLGRTAYELTENLPVGTYTMLQPPDGGLAQFRFMSTKFLELTGLSREEAYADPLKGFACVHPDDYDEWVTLNAQAFANRESFWGETRVIVNGTTRWITAESKPRELADGSVLWEGVLTDITKRKLAEQSLAHAKAHAEKLERLKTDFLTQMSHEIRTPLTTILGLAALLDDKTLTLSQRDRVKKIRASGKLLTGIVNDILDLSKIEAGQLITEELPFNLATVLDTVETFRTSISNPAVSLAVVPPKNPVPLLIGDQRRIEQVLANLLSNAIKFTEQGAITVTVECQQTAPFKASLQITVQDTGIGITPTFMTQIFTPFRQSDSGIARSYGGTGLGLSISKQLMEIMGGQIHVTSEPGQGSTFWFDLSLTTVDRNRFQQRHSTSTPLTTSRRLVGLYILVVDDSLAIRQLVQQLLEREGAQVTIAADGAHALTVLQQADEPFDCVMMDIQMPVMDGLTATQNIRALPQFDNLPVLAMTAGLFAEQQARARQAGMTDVIAKPIDIDHMINQILISVGRNNGGHGSNGATNPNPMPLIAGIDRDHVNRTLDGDSKLFDKLVLIFIQEFEGLDDRIRECLAQDDHPYSIKEAIRFSHTLNGAASQIGAIELSQAAVALEQALTNESGASLPKLDAMGKLLADLISSLKQHLASL